jgi:hypothetical protein
MESRRCGTSPYCGMARAPTDCPRPTSNFWRASITCSEQVGLIDLCSGDGTRFAVWMMLYPCSLMLVRRAAVTATLYALIVMLMVPTRAPTMELKVVGTQLILSGPVVGDEPEKVREALASSPGIDTMILRNSGGGDAPLSSRSVASRTRFADASRRSRKWTSSRRELTGTPSRTSTIMPAMRRQR